jgi:hypothetical protein
MSKQVRDSAGHLWPEIVGRLGTTTFLAVDNTSQQSHAAGTGVTLMRVAVANTDSHIHFEIGTDPTATSTSKIMPAPSVEYFRVEPGEKIAFLRGSSSNINVSITDILPS